MKKIQIDESMGEILFPYIEAIRSNADLPPLLPLVHTTRFDDGIKHIKNNNKITKPEGDDTCECFDYNPVYLFYGIPGYWPRKKDPLQAGNEPLIFILNEKYLEECLKDIIAIYPCDTGAHKHGFYSKNTIGINWCFWRFRNCFKMGSDASILRKYVEIFFGDNQNYWECGRDDDRAKPERGKLAGNAIIDAFVELLENPKDSRLDERRGIVEIQTKEIESLAEYLQAIVICDGDISDENKWLLDELKKNGIEIIEYPKKYETSYADEYISSEEKGMIRKKVFEIISRKECDIV
ncbi:MAG: hypothetical protein LBO74_02745 [Candidatus Symbiothrix sp.]|jgi:hypothetical protein|nr:hypothetical protein [Candidatus Symbiothrix sp.]